MNKIATALTDDIKSIAIAGHVNPDGDCVGSCIGLYLYLKENYKHIQTDIYLERIREDFRFLKGTEDVRFECEPNKVYDLIITCDASSLDRIGVINKIYPNAKHTLCIDHHISNGGFAKENHIVAEGSSTSEVLYELLDEKKITKEIAEGLYMGIVHDTGIFQYSATTSRTMLIAGKLMDLGIDFSKIVDQTFQQKSYAQNQILGKTLLESFMILNNKCIVGCVKQREMDFYGVTKKDLDGIVSQLRVTKGIEVALFLYETNPQEFKVSLRSNGKVNVSEIATAHGGGGHVLAAGCTMQGTAHDVITNLAQYIEQQLEKTS